MKKIILIILIVIFILVIFFFQWFFSPIDSTEIIKFEIESGQTAKEIATNLEKEGIIKNEFIFYFYIFWQKEQANLKAGTYYLSPSMTVPEIINLFILGQAERITIPEGLRTEDIAELLDKPNFIEISHQDFSNEFSFLKEIPDNISLEGYLFPDTYDILPGMSCEEIIRMMLRNFENKTKNIITGKSLFEIITMASLIEKEVRSLEDKKIVSGILWKRIENNMPLQVDASIVYIISKRTTRISIAETRIESPYNTYLNLGLPIGPISNPGLDSIKAAINPQESDYWFYLSKPTGETVFSRNFEEHVKAKLKYLTD